MNFSVHGSYEIPRLKNHLISRDKTERNEFWDMVEDDEEGLSYACGCYVLSIRGVPWYVGMAQRQDFRHECFSHHKITLFDTALLKGPGKPHLHLLARRTPGGKFCKPSANAYRDVEFLENLLIGLGLQRNEELMNIKGTTLLRNMRVPGFVNTRKGEARAHAVIELREILGNSP
jgi:hypothetical protein